MDPSNPSAYCPVIFKPAWNLQEFQASAINILLPQSCVHLAVCRAHRSEERRLVCGLGHCSRGRDNEAATRSSRSCNKCRHAPELRGQLPPQDFHCHLEDPGAGGEAIRHRRRRQVPCALCHIHRWLRRATSRRSSELRARPRLVPAWAYPRLSRTRPPRNLIHSPTQSPRSSDRLEGSSNHS